MRPRALPPILVRENGIVSLHPVDVPSRGTWIAVNELGLTLCLLNVNQPCVMPAPAGLGASSLRSRGELIPRLSSHATALDALRQLIAMDLSEYPPFRMLAVDEHESCLLSSTHTVAPTVKVFAPSPRLMLASSGLGDELVTTVRDQLFKELLSNEHHDLHGMQDAYHAHSWPGRENISVLMSREEARTVSTTAVHVLPSTITMHYREIPETPNAQVPLYRPLLLTRTPRTRSARSTVYS